MTQQPQHSTPEAPHLQTFSLPSFADNRGRLTCLDLQACDSQFPFPVQRVFWITEVGEGEKRGSHAHRRCWEALLAVGGSFKLKIDNGHDAPWVETVSSSHKGVIIPPMVWCELFDFTPGCACLCFASGSYDQEGYLKTYSDFLHAVKAQ